MLKTQDFIESGILESYLLGIATDEEQHVVNQMILTHSEVSDYIMRFEKNLQRYFIQNAVPPPTDVREILLLETNKTDIRKQEKDTYHNIPKDHIKQKEDYLEIEVNDTYIKVHKWWRPAFIGVFILSKIFLIAGLYYYFKASSQEKEIEKLKTEITASRN